MARLEAAGGKATLRGPHQTGLSSGHPAVQVPLPTLGASHPPVTFTCLQREVGAQVTTKALSASQFCDSWMLRACRSLVLN